MHRIQGFARYQQVQLKTEQNCNWKPAAIQNYKLCGPQSAYSEQSLNQEDFLKIKGVKWKAQAFVPDPTASVLEGIHPSHPVSAARLRSPCCRQALISWSWKRPTASQTALKEHFCGTTRSHTRKIHAGLLRVLSTAWREELRALICPRAVCSQWEQQHFPLEKWSSPFLLTSGLTKILRDIKNK